VRSHAALEGKEVSVVGYLRFGDDTRNLWNDKEALLAVSGGNVLPNDPAWNRCITLYDADKWRSILLSKDEKYVKVSGIVRFEAARPGEITFGACSDLGISIRSIEDASAKR
jgi:hypothetical protein